jgi:phosphopantetheinyl transferase (holo-ACP synthase)
MIELADFKIRIEPTWGSENPLFREKIRRSLLEENPGFEKLMQLETLPQVSGKSISISHAHKLGGYASLNGAQIIGFDLANTERVLSSKLGRVKRHFHQATANLPLDFLWTAKEASFKCLSQTQSVGSLKDISVIEWNRRDDGVIQFQAKGKEAIKLSGLAWRSSGYTFAIAIQ